MQSNIDNSSTYQCNFCLIYVPLICQEVHNVKCLMKIYQEKTTGNSQDEQQQNINLEDFRLLSNKKDQTNQVQQFPQQKVNLQQLRNDQKIQQNQQNTLNRNPSIRITNNNNNLIQNESSITSQQQQQIQSLSLNPAFQQQNIMQQQNNSKININQQTQRFLNLQRMSQLENQSTNNIFRTNQVQQQQSLIFPQKQQQQQQSLQSLIFPSQQQQQQQQQQQKSLIFPQQQQQQQSLIFPQQQQQQQQQQPLLFPQSQQQQQQQLLFPQQQFGSQQGHFNQLTRNLNTPSSSQPQNMSQIIPQQNSINVGSFRMLSQFRQNIFSDDSDESNNEEVYEVSGLNNFDLLRNYTDEEVNQMNDEQFYQYFIHRQIIENHVNEPDSQLQKMITEQDKYDNQCVICQDAITNEDETRILDCLHKFHKDCISNWFKCKSTCPICKTSI